MIKKILLLILQLTAVAAFSQAPQLINYQGTARDASGDPVANQNISLKFEFKQGSNTVFTETQTGIATSALGLFSTQIGKSTSLSSVNWQSGNFALEVSVDPSGGSSFTSMGQQQIVSVPYALSVPASYSNNVLTIGGQSFSISSSSSASQVTLTTSGIGTVTSTGNALFDLNIPATSLIGAGSATVTGSFPNYTVTTPAQAAAPATTLTSSGVGTIASAGTNSFDIDIPATSISSGTNVTVNGSYPNYTISSTPSLAISNNQLSIAGSNTITLPSAPATNLVGTGAAQVVNLSANSYSVDVPVTTITSGTNVTVNGSFPSFTVSSNPALIISGNNMSISGGNTVALPAPSYDPASGALTTGTAVTAITPTLGFNGNILTVGPPTNTIAFPTAVAPSIIPGGIVTVTASGNSFTVSAPAPVFDGSNGTLTTGTNVANITPTLAVSGNVLTVGPTSNSVSLPAQITPTINGTGATTVSGTYPSLTINSPSTSLTGAGSATVSGAFPNYTISTTNTASTNLTGAGSTTVSGTFPNYTVNSPSTSLTGAGSATVSGTFPNYTISTTNTASTNLTGAGSTTVSGTFPNYTVNSPSTSLTGAGSATVTGAFPNYTISTTNTASTNLTGAGSTTVSGTFPNYTVNSSSTSLTGAGSTTVSGTFPNYTINSPSTSLAGAGSATVSGTFPNYTVTTPSIPSPSVTGTGLATVSPTVGTSFTVNVPVPAYNASNGTLAFGSNTLSVNPQLSISGNTLTSGSASNSVDLSSIGAWSQSGGTVSISASTVNVGIGTTTTSALLTVDNHSVTSRYGISLLNAKDAVGAALPMLLSISTAGQTFGTNTYGRILRMSNTALTADFDFGIDQNSSLFISRINNYGPADITLNSSGFIGLNKSSPSERLDVTGNVRFSGALMPNNSAGTAGQVLTSSGAGAAPVWTTATSSGWATTGNSGTNPSTNFLGTTDAADLIFKTSNAEALRIYTNGNISIGGAGQTGGKLNVSMTSAANGSYAVSGALNYNPTSAGGGLAASGYFINYTNANNGGTQLNTAVTGYLSLSGNNFTQYNTGGWMHAIANGGSHSKMSGVMGTFENYGASITNAYGGYFEHFTNTGSIANGYGVYIGGMLGTNKWSLYASDVTAPSFFAGNVGIGTAAPSATLHVAGTMRLEDGSQAAGKVLTSDASGNASWSNAPSRNTGFMVSVNSSQSIGTNAFTPVAFGVEDYDDGNNFAANTYVCPSTGVYQFNASIAWQPMTSTTAGAWSHISFYINGNPVKYVLTPTSTGYATMHLDGSFKCSAGDQVQIFVYHQSTGAELLYGNPIYSFFSGHRVY